MFRYGKLMVTNINKNKTICSLNDRFIKKIFI